MPVTLRHQGMALPDVLVGLVLLGLAGTAGTSMWLHATRVARGATDRVRISESFEASLGFLAADLAELAPGDLIGAAPRSITYRAVRLDGHACLVASGVVHVARARLRASRLPQAGRDSLLILVPTDSGPNWVASGITTVGLSQCGTEPSIGIVGDSARLASLSFQPPVLLPVKTFEVMEARLYTSAGAGWLGARSVSAGEAIQPVAGPFESGSTFRVLDSAGAPTTASTARTVVPVMEALGPAWLGRPSGRRDTALVELHPRNLWP